MPHDLKINETSSISCSYKHIPPTLWQQYALFSFHVINMGEFLALDFFHLEYLLFQKEHYWTQLLKKPNPFPTQWQ